MCIILRFVIKVGGTEASEELWIERGELGFEFLFHVHITERLGENWGALSYYCFLL